MKRPIFALMALLLMSGCASTGSNYYSYEGSGDYYYGAQGADVVIDSSSYGYGFSGLSAGYGYGYGYGYGGYGGYGSPYSYWNHGYQPIWWGHSNSHQGPHDSRHVRVEDERARRGVLVRRDTIQAPESAKWLSPQQVPRTGFLSPYARPSASTGRGYGARRAAPASRGDTMMRSSSTSRSAPSMSRSAPPPMPTRSSAPAQHSSSRRQ